MTGDEDVFFYDPRHRCRSPSATVGQTGYTDDPVDARPGSTTPDQPAISVVPDPASPVATCRSSAWSGPTASSNTVVDPEEDGMTQLFEAYVPDVSIKTRCPAFCASVPTPSRRRWRRTSRARTSRCSSSGASPCSVRPQYRLVRTLATKPLSSTSAPPSPGSPRPRARTTCAPGLRRHQVLCQRHGDGAFDRVGLQIPTSATTARSSGSSLVAMDRGAAARLRRAAAPPSLRRREAPLPEPMRVACIVVK